MSSATGACAVDPGDIAGRGGALLVAAPDPADYGTAPRAGLYEVRVGTRATLDPYITDSGTPCPYRIGLARNGVFRAPLPSL